MKILRLSELPMNTPAKVVSIGCDERLKQRLGELGLYEGETVTAVLKSPLGQPRAYMIGGAVIALRNSDCKKIKAEL